MINLSDYTASGGGGLAFLASSSFTNAASVDFTAFDAAKYESYIFVLKRVDLDQNGGPLLLQVSDDAGATWKSGGYGGIIKELGGGASEVEFFSAVELTGNEGNEVTGQIWVYGAGDISDTHFGMHLMDRSDPWFGSGRYTGNVAVNAVRFKQPSGNISSGMIAIYGVVKG